MQLRFNKILSKPLSTLYVCLVFVVSISITFYAQPAGALSGSEFRAGNIIDNSVFFNGRDMSIDEIQRFLNSKVPHCDTNGTQMYNSTQTRAAYSASKGHNAPFICLKDYRQDTPLKNAEDGLCTGLGAGNKSAALIIYEVGVSCGVNPKVIITLLQKEQSLVTDDWPWDTQYRSATGYGCPDTAPCDAEYYGFFNQVYSAARQFKRYAKEANRFNYRAGVNNYILYNPSTACGGSTVYIQNQATAGLYNYTPYQPNQAALSNLYGNGDSCSSYGNRNFWRIYNDWFGLTYGACTNNEVQMPYARSYYNSRTFQHYYSAWDCDATYLPKLGFANEGPIFNTTPPDMPWAVPVHRLYNPSTGSMFFTINQSDIDFATKYAGFKYDRIGFYSAASYMPGIHPVYRLYNPSISQHLWVGSQAAVDFATKNAGYVYEGIAFYSQ